MRAMLRLIETRQRLASHPRQHAIHRLQHGDLLAHPAQHGCCLKPDVTATDNRNLRDVIKCAEHRIDICAGANDMDARQIATLALQPARASASGPNHLAIAYDIAIRRRDRKGRRIDSFDTLSKQHINIALCPECRRPDHDPLERFFACKIVLRQWRAFIGIFRFGVDNTDAALELCLPQRDCRLRPTMPAANNQHVKLQHGSHPFFQRA